MAANNNNNNNRLTASSNVKNPGGPPLGVASSNKFATATDAHSFFYGTHANSSVAPATMMGGGATKSGVAGPNAYAMAQQQSSAYFGTVGGTNNNNRISNKKNGAGRNNNNNTDDDDEGDESSRKNRRRGGMDDESGQQQPGGQPGMGNVVVGDGSGAGAAGGLIPWNQVTLPPSHLVDVLLSRVAGNVAIVKSVKPGDAMAKKQKMKDIMAAIQQQQENNQQNAASDKNGTVKSGAVGRKRMLASHGTKTSGFSPPNTTAAAAGKKLNVDGQSNDDPESGKNQNQQQQQEEEGKEKDSQENKNSENNNNNNKKAGGELKDEKYSFSFPVPSHHTTDSKSPNHASNNKDNTNNDNSEKKSTDADAVDAAAVAPVAADASFQSPAKDGMNENPNPDGQSPRNELIQGNIPKSDDEGSSVAQNKKKSNDNSASAARKTKMAEEKAKLEAEAATKTMTAARARSLASHSVITHFYDYNGNSKTNLFQHMLNQKMNKVGVTNKSNLMNNLVNGTTMHNKSGAASGATESNAENLNGTTSKTGNKTPQTNNNLHLSPNHKNNNNNKNGLGVDGGSFNRSDFLTSSAANSNPNAEVPKRIFEREYTKHQMLGRGSFGETWLVEWTGVAGPNGEEPICPSAYSALACTKPHVKLSDGQQIPAEKAFVCKVEAKSMAKKKGQGGNAQGAEERILANCAHPCIVAYVEEFDDKSHHYLVMEYVDGGDLRQEVQRRSDGDNVKYFSEASLLFLFVQIVMAVEYLHRYNVLHRDLKSANILLSKKWLVKLADFGFAKQYDQQDVDHNVSTTTLGTPYYMAPELFRRETYSDKADMWSLGCILYELITLRRPFDGDSVQALAHAVINDDYADLQRDNISEELVALLDALLDKDPIDRPSAKQVLQSAIMRNAMEEFIGKFSRAANASNSALDRSWCKVLLEHQQVVLADTLSSPKSRVAMSRMRSVAMSNRMMSSSRGGGVTSRASRRDYDDDDDDY